MTKALITIIVPTFNRCKNLALLLNTLLLELDGLQDKVHIIIGDNASNDETPVLTALFKEKYPSAVVLRHAENLGGDENFCRCIDQVKSKYFWIFGDDDLPKSGTLRGILKILDDTQADILYLNSEWKDHISGSTDGEVITTLSSNKLNRLAFARQVNIWFTFISGVIVNFDSLRRLNSEFNQRKFSGTSLVQLGWILPLLMTGENFQIINQRCILATSGNTGGYKLFTVFGNNLPKILAEECGSGNAEYRVIMEQLCWSYIPRLLWMNRFSNLGKFESEGVMESMAPLRFSLAYWILMYPLSCFNKFSSYPFLFIVKLASKFMTLKNGIFP